MTAMKTFWIPGRDVAGNVSTFAVAIAVALAAVTISGCCKKPQPKGIGRKLFAGPAHSLSLSSDGKTLVFVGDIVPPQEKDVPKGIFLGTLTVIPRDSGVPRPLGGGVSTLDGGYRLSSDGKYVAYLQGFRFRDQSGTLHLASLPTGEARQIAPSAKQYAFSPDGRYLGYVADGELHLLELTAEVGSAGSDRRVATDISTLEFSRDGKRVLFRRPAASGGELLLVSVEPGAHSASSGQAAPVKIGEYVGDYTFSPDSTRPSAPRLQSRDVSCPWSAPGST